MNENRRKMCETNSFSSFILFSSSWLLNHEAITFGEWKQFWTSFSQFETYSSERSNTSWIRRGSKWKCQYKCCGQEKKLTRKIEESYRSFKWSREFPFGCPWHRYAITVSSQWLACYAFDSNAYAGDCSWSQQFWSNPNIELWLTNVVEYIVEGQQLGWCREEVWICSIKISIAAFFWNLVPRKNYQMATIGEFLTTVSL